MMRSLWTSASGMIAQQTSVDNIANNLSNVNTVGYKKQSTEFQTLLYSKLQTDVTDNNGDPKPVLAQVGAGVRVSGVSTQYTQGTPLETGGTYDFAIEGRGFFMVQMPDGSRAYTRNGSFNLSIGEEGVTLANAEGYPVLDANGEPIVFEDGIDVANLKIDDRGDIYVTDTVNQVDIPLDRTIGLAQFNNPAGLEKMAGSLLLETANSGEARMETEDTELKRSKLLNGYLEGSNVESIDEIVNLIVAQRAYEMNSKAIAAADSMLQTANNLRS